jgi:hypothetical protein
MTGNRSPISFASTKGGVGKTTLAYLIATACRGLGQLAARHTIRLSDYPAIRKYFGPVLPDTVGWYRNPLEALPCGEARRMHPWRHSCPSGTYADERSSGCPNTRITDIPDNRHSVQWTFRTTVSPYNRYSGQPALSGQPIFRIIPGFPELDSHETVPAFSRSHIAPPTNGLGFLALTARLSGQIGTCAP